ncbi:hypothetical protein JYU34_002997 [Plutella xylostella]|uniref:Uncharacterized protein n=1 Tax=Plutella xylostella TaxID=51655 RepID=A0ABQ7R3N5_PLUXY|nr:hypothetical protein JYU34_002997 [Plutella xylostella]
MLQLHGGAGRDGGRGLLPAGAERAGVRGHLPAAPPPPPAPPPPRRYVVHRPCSHTGALNVLVFAGIYLQRRRPRPRPRPRAGMLYTAPAARRGR